MRTVPLCTKILKFLILDSKTMTHKKLRFASSTVNVLSRNEILVDQCRSFSLKHDYWDLENQKSIAVTPVTLVATRLVPCSDAPPPSSSWTSATLRSAPPEALKSLFEKGMLKHLAKTMQIFLYYFLVLL